MIRKRRIKGTMKTKPIPLTALALLMFAWPAAAQVGSPPSREATASANNSAIVQDGLVVYRGNTYLIRNGRAAQINRALVPEGQVLTDQGTLVPLPPNYIGPTGRPEAIHDGIMYFGGQTYLIRNGTAALINQSVVPDGHVLTPNGRLAPLPSDFSGFTLERTPAGTSALPRFTVPGQQSLSGQAGVPQVPSSTITGGSRLSSGAAGSSAVGVNSAGQTGQRNGSTSSRRGSNGVDPDSSVTNDNGTGINANGTISTGGGVALDSNGAVINADGGVGFVSGFNGNGSASTQGGTNANGNLSTQSGVGINGTNGAVNGI
ncbi:MAG: hypothetical protein JWR15_486, partial [Prosthecobacter sp.]|nr:hypothetical protein [Prosthecobacter sp.]